MLTISEGKVMDGKVTIQLMPTLEHGKLDAVHALIMHQTGGSSAKGTLEGYKNSTIGAHFLIDKDGTIYQTARVNQICFHVGKISSRCHNLKNCAPEDATAIDTILKSKKSYSRKVKELSDHEAEKDYPARYPSNSDSLGIEVAGEATNGKYCDPTAEQAKSVKWLVTELLTEFKLTTTDVYRHPEVSYKEPSEAENVKW